MSKCTTARVLLFGACSLASAFVQDPLLVPTNQWLTPSGARLTFGLTRPVDLTQNLAGTRYAVLWPNSVRIYSRNNVLSRVVDTLSTIGLQASIGGITFSPDGLFVAASLVSLKPGPDVVMLVSIDPKIPPIQIQLPANSTPAGLLFDPAGQTLCVALNKANSVAVIDIPSATITATIPVGVAPYGIATDASRTHLFVTNWGGSRPQAGDVVATSAGTSVLVDHQGIASSGSVSVIDLGSLAITTRDRPARVRPPEPHDLATEIPVGLHPSRIATSPDGNVIAVANSNSDTISLIDPFQMAVVNTIAIPAYPQGYAGSAPTGLAFSPDGARLYATCGGNNALAVLTRLNSQAYSLAGFVPTDWYPLAVASSVNSAGIERIMVANSKGTGNEPGNGPYDVRSTQGTITDLSLSDVLSAGTDVITASNNPFQNYATPSDSPPNLVALGIQHVFLIIKENRTYDQILGDLGRGNGSINNSLYGFDITPNQHQLALQFVTLDNFFASGFVSTDGHQWLTQAMNSDYLERSFAAYPRGTPFDGSDPMAFVPSGFLWSNAINSGQSVRVYGEFTQPAANYSGHTWAAYLSDAVADQRKLSAPSVPSVAAMAPIVETSYPAFSMDIPDSFRARLFLDKFNAYVANGDLPNLVIVWLPCDHTIGTIPGLPTPNAMLADNDVATGRIIDAISHSPYWPTSAIFVTEDDAQDGVDHVDGHRTTCFVASPFSRRGSVDSTPYNHTSLVRSIEEMLGLPPMNKFDASALPMRSVFRMAPDYTPYQFIQNQVSLTELTPSLTAMKGAARKAAIQSMKMNFAIPDAAPEEELNRILWRAAKGWRAKYPSPKHTANCPKNGESCQILNDHATVFSR